MEKVQTDDICSLLTPNDVTNQREVIFHSGTEVFPVVRFVPMIFHLKQRRTTPGHNNCSRQKKQQTFTVDNLKSIRSMSLTFGNHEKKAKANAYEVLRVFDGL